MTDSKQEIEKIAAMILPPMTAARAPSGEIIHSDIAIGARCDRGHKGSYFLSDVVGCRGAISCTTCGLRGRYPNLVRAAAEKLFKVPFSLMERPKCNSGVVEFGEESGSIIISCCDRISGTSVRGNARVVCVGKTTSAKRARSEIIDQLRGEPLPQHLFLCLPVMKRGGRDRDRDRDRDEKKTPLPKTAAMGGGRDGSAKAIRSKYLCIESCIAK